LLSHVGLVVGRYVAGSEYRVQVLKRVPQLVKLDGIPVGRCRLNQVDP
jgi:hypothetical protein